MGVAVMHTLKFTLFMALIFLSSNLLTGCTTTAIPGAQPDLLAFLTEGETTREEIIMTLGQPSGTYEQESILAYRLGHDPEQGYFIVINHGTAWQWHNVRYSLVLLIDENGVLKKKRLVDVQN